MLAGVGLGVLALGTGGCTVISKGTFPSVLSSVSLGCSIAVLRGSHSCGCWVAVLGGSAGALHGSSGSSHAHGKMPCPSQSWEPSGSGGGRAQNSLAVHPTWPFGPLEAMQQSTCSGLLFVSDTITFVLASVVKRFALELLNAFENLTMCFRLSAAVSE